MAFQGKFESIVSNFPGELPFHRRFDFKKSAGVRPPIP